MDPRIQIQKIAKESKPAVAVSSELDPDEVRLRSIVLRETERLEQAFARRLQAVEVCSPVLRAPEHQRGRGGVGGWGLV